MYMRLCKMVCIEKGVGYCLLLDSRSSGISNRVIFNSFHAFLINNGFSWKREAANTTL